MRRFIRGLFFRVLPAGRLPADRASILMYHSVGGAAHYFSAITPEAFEAQMAYLRDHRISVISLTELVHRLLNGEVLGGSVALTFDDGYEDNYTVAFPVLRRYGFPATIFVATDHIGTTDKRGFKRLSPSQLQELEESRLVRIEPHTRSHPHLPRLPRTVQKEEISGAKGRLEELLGTVCRVFAYPYGAYDAATVALVRAAGFEAACSVRPGTVSSVSDRFTLPRNPIDQSTSFAEFRGKLSRAIDRYEACKRLVRP